MSNPLSQRRRMIRSLAAGGLLLPGVLSELTAADAPGAVQRDPLAAKPPHFPARARRVIFLFLTGGLSHIDTFDDKPLLRKYHDLESRCGGQSVHGLSNLCMDAGNVLCPGFLPNFRDRSYVYFLLCCQF